MRRRAGLKALFGENLFPLVFAHRGYSSQAPENTLSAFSLALGKGVPGIELDVHLCSSGELVVIHDYNLKRTTGMDARVEETEYQVIRSLDAGAWYGEAYKGERIPLLSEVFELLGKNVYYDLEIKHESRNPGDLETKLIDLIKRHNLLNNTIVSSFNPFALKAIRERAQEIPTAIIYSTDKEVPAILRHGEGRWISGCGILKPDSDKVSRGYMIFHRLFGGYPIIPWTVNDLKEARRLLDLDVDGIISDDPAPILEMLRVDYSKGIPQG